MNRALAKEIGTSFTPVREAINRLASEGLVEYVAGSGAFVRRVDRHELSQLYDVRELFEPFAAAEAAQHITAHEIDELRSICKDWKSITSSLSEKRLATEADMNRWLDNEERFHGLLISASRNRWLEDIMSDLRLAGHCFQPQRSKPEILTIKVAKSTIASHEALIKALAARDPEKANALTLEQIQRGRKAVLAHFDQQRSES